MLCWNVLNAVGRQAHCREKGYKNENRRGGILVRNMYALPINRIVGSSEAREDCGDKDTAGDNAAQGRSLKIATRPGGK